MKEKQKKTERNKNGREILYLQKERINSKEVKKYILKKKEIDEKRSDQHQFKKESRGNKKVNIRNID